MARKLVVEIIGDASSLEKSFKQAQGKTNTFGNSLKRVGKVAAFTAGGAALGGLFVTLRRGVDEFNETQKVTAQTRAVLRSTGKAAGVTEKHIGDLASELSRMSGVDDEVIQAQENMLLSFTKVRNEVGKGNDIFDRANRVILDYSVRTGTDGTSAAKLFGKALNEIAQKQIPKSIRGIGKLTDETQKEIKAHLDAGDAAGAQAVLLEVLEKRYRGAAKAGGDTFAGSLNKLNNAFDEIAGTIVKAAAPAIEEYVDKLTVWLSKSENQEKIQKAVTDTMRVLGGVIKTVSDVVKTMAPIVQKIVDLFGGWKNVLIAIIALKFASKLTGIIGGLTGITSAIGGPKGVLSQMKALRASAALPILFSIGFSLAQIGSSSRSTGSIPGGPQDIQSQVGDLTAYYDPIDKKHRLVRVRKGESPQQAAMRDFKSRHPGKGRGTAATIPRGATTGAAMTGATRIPQGLGPGATTTPGTRSPAAVVLNGPVTVVANNPDEFIRGMQKWAKRQTASRTGRFGGHNLGFT